jgi:hypothetical protein
MPHDVKPQETIIVPDTTFWGRFYGVVVFRSWNLKRNIWWNEVSSERVAALTLALSRREGEAVNT